MLATSVTSSPQKYPRDVKFGNQGIIKTEDQPIGIFIGRINSKYAKYYNKKYNYIGNLSQDRFHLELIEKDTQMLLISRYIHLNPVRAKMVSSPIEYRQSSYNIYLNEEKRNIWNMEYLLIFRCLGSFRREKIQ